jgi:molybdopterin-guanine dinucleotide biosynthesis protein A
VFDAIILAGASSRRLDGADKAAVEIGGMTLLDRVIAACHDAERIIVVGPERPTEQPVRWAREDPPDTGPVAAVAAGLGQVEEAYCLILASDLPWIAPAVTRVLSAATKTDVAVLTRAGRRNNLVAVWRSAALRAALESLDGTRDRAVRDLFGGVQVTEVPDEADWGLDCDTWDDIETARAKEST